MDDVSIAFFMPILLEIEMTYRELIKQLEKLTAEQLDCTVTVDSLDRRECYPAGLAITENDHDSLDEGHPILTID